MKILLTSIVTMSFLAFSGLASSDDADDNNYQHGVPFQNESETESYDYRDYGSEAQAKVFAVSGSSVNGSVLGNLIYDTEVRHYDRTLPDQYSYARNRKQGGEFGIGVNFSVVTLDTSGDELTLTKFERYNNSGIVLKETRTMSPGVVFRTESMETGKSFGSYSSLNSSKKGISSVIQSVTLLGLEDVVVPAGSYTACLKILRHRNSERLGGEYDRINWFCPNGVGLAKQVTMTNTQTATVMELTSMTP